MTAMTMRQWHEQASATFGEVTGCEVVLSYGEALLEYEALRKSAGLLDLSFRGRLCLGGNDRVRFLHGQVTNDVQRLKEGQGCYAALVSAKGKIESDLNVYCLKDELLLDFEPGLASKLMARFEKFIIADDVQVVDVAPHYGLLSVQGLRAEEVVRDCGLISEIPDRPLGFSRGAHGAVGEIYGMRNSRGPGVGFDLFIPVAGLVEAAGKLRNAVENVEGRLCGWSALEVARIEAGLPRFEQDMDESNLAPEAGIEARAISYAKGCYIGQEVISRIRAYGQVAKALRGLRLSGPTDSLPKKGERIFFGDKEVGYITSAVHSPAMSANIALGYVRREHNAVGTDLTVRAGDQSVSAQIVPLPFVSSA